MDKIVFTVHEFMAIMGSMDENLAGKKAPESSVYNEWHEQWKVLDERLEELDPMPRADMLFDGKVTINVITEPQLKEVIVVVESQVAMHEMLIKDDDEDADEGGDDEGGGDLFGGEMNENQTNKDNNITTP